jgi:hypothetical protein
MKPTLSKLLRRLERRKRLHDPKFQLCTRCGAPPGQRGILTLKEGVLEQLPRRPDGTLVPFRCPGCLEAPRIVLPESKR